MAGGIGGLDGWLALFLAVMQRKTRRAWAPLYVQGLLGPGERKSVQPMAERRGWAATTNGSVSWRAPPGTTPRCGRCWPGKLTGWWAARLVGGPVGGRPGWWAARLVGGKAACLVIDDTALPKQGRLSVGVARQCCGQLGKRANCQSLVSLTLAQGEVPVLVSLRLFLPDEWVADPERCARAGVPEAEMAARAKGETALAELDRVRVAGVRFGCVLADAGCGGGAVFRHALDERRLPWAVGIARNQKVCGTDVQLVPPIGRARKLVPDQEPQAAGENALPRSGTATKPKPARRAPGRCATAALPIPSTRPVSLLPAPAPNACPENAKAMLERVTNVPVCSKADLRALAHLSACPRSSHKITAG